MNKVQLSEWAKVIQSPSSQSSFATPSKSIQAALRNLPQARLHEAAQESVGPATATPLVMHEGVVERALANAQNGLVPGVLVFCSATRPGGGWVNGAIAQEEAISYCSSWALQCEHPQFHTKSRRAPFYGTELLVAKGALVASEPGRWLDEPVDCHFAGFAAPNMRALKAHGGKPDHPKIVEQTYQELCTGFSNTLSALRRAGCSAVILGPIGCGVFEGDPMLCAKAAHSALEANGARIRHIEFALGANPAPRVAQAFAEVFKVFQILAPKPRSAC